MLYRDSFHRSLISGNLIGIGINATHSDGTGWAEVVTAHTGRAPRQKGKPLPFIKQDAPSRAVIDTEQASGTVFKLTPNV